MAATQDGNIGIWSGYTPGDNGWTSQHNQNWDAIDALVQPTVKSVTTTTPPTSPANGDAYVVPVGATGAWSGYTGKIAVWVARNSAWTFYSPKAGWKIINQADSGMYVYSGMAWASAFAQLDGTGKVPVAQLPAAVVGAMNFQGLWNASTNSPALTSGVGTKGYYYKVSTGGTTTIDGNSQWNVGDLIVFDGTTWDKVDGVSSEVVSVAGRTGAVTLSVTDIAGAAALAGSSSQVFNVAPATASTHAVPLGQIQTLLGNFSKSTTYVNGATSWTSSQTGVAVSVNAGNQTLPLASGCIAGNSFLFYAANPIAVVTSGSDTIYIQGTQVSSVAMQGGDWALFIYNGSEWEVMAASPRLLIVESLRTVLNIFDDGSGNATIANVLEAATGQANQTGVRISSDPSGVYMEAVPNGTSAAAYYVSGLGGATLDLYKVLAKNFYVIGTLQTGVYTVATLPTGVVGARATVNDAVSPTFLGALTGGGSGVCPVFYNGSAWVVG